MARGESLAICNSLSIKEYNTVDLFRTTALTDKMEN